MKALLIIAKKGYQDIEYGDTRSELENAGVEVTVGGEAKGEAEGGFGGRAIIDQSFADIRVSGFDAIVFIGGSGAVGYQKDTDAHRITREASQQNKVLAAICIAPTILAYAGVLKGKKATTWDDGRGTQATILEENGAIYTGEDITQDDRLITASGPHVAKNFGKTIVKALKS